MVLLVDALTQMEPQHPNMLTRQIAFDRMGKWCDRHQSVQSHTDNPI